MVNEQTSVAQIVLDHSETAAVFQRRGIDYCCRGELALSDACQARGVDLASMLNELKVAIASRQGSASDDPRLFSTALLIDRIVRRHHRFLRDALPFLVPLAKKVARVHSAHNANLLDLRDAVEELNEVLIPHLDQEEEDLFPRLTSSSAQAEIVAAELTFMRADHLEVSALLTRMRNAAHDYVAPDWACTSYTTLLHELQAVEADLFEHVHLENHVLLPRFQKV